MVYSELLLGISEQIGAADSFLIRAVPGSMEPRQRAQHLKAEAHTVSLNPHDSPKQRRVPAHPAGEGGERGGL